jgi:two-component system sensor histidine kinase PilS (NtrC family)
VLLTVVLVVTLLFFQNRYQIYRLPNATLYKLSLLIGLLTILYVYHVRTRRKLLLLAYLQTMFDVVLITILVFLTGAADSGFSILYHVAIISSCIFLQRRGGYLAASLSSIFYGTLLDLQFYNVWGLSRSQNYSDGQVLYQVFVHILSFYSVAFLAGYLTERLRATHQELRTKSEDFDELRILQQQILRNVGSGILTINLQGEMTSWNRAAGQITGYGPGEMRENWKSIFADSIKELFGHTDILRQHARRFTCRIVKRDGTIVSLGMTASLLLDDADNSRGIILSFQDITKIIELEEQVRLQERLASIGGLAAGIAHEIRNPLASLSGSVQLLQAGLDLRDDEKRLMSIVVRETDRLNTIITEFLDYARPRSIVRETINLHDLLEETCSLVRNSTDLRVPVLIETSIDPGIELRGDPQRLRQVFWNIFINACQAMPNGGTVQITAKPYSTLDGDQPWCEISVQDSGEGIAPQNLKNIFNPFFTTKPGGTGLGLAIAYRIVDDHRGFLAVESEPGHGAVFFIRLPITDEAFETRTMLDGQRNSFVKGQAAHG